MNTKVNKIVSEDRKKIYNQWRKARGIFEELWDELCPDRRNVDGRVSAFYQAYATLAKEYGEIEGIELPEEYEVLEKEESLDTLLKKSESTNIIGDFFWAYQTPPATATMEEAPSAGAWFFLDMKKNNKNKFADLSIKILDKLASQEDEQKSRETDYTKAMGLLEGAAEKHLSSERLGEIRRTIRRGSERIREQSEISSGAN